MQRFRTVLLTTCFVPVLALAQGDMRRAEIRGGGDGGKCTIEVEVDQVAEVIIDRDTAYLRTVSGQPAAWRRFVCNQVMPSSPNNFRFRGIDGRGRQTLIRTPDSNRGRAVIQLEDTKGGREGYTFDVEWNGGTDTNYGNGGYNNGGRYNNGPGNNNGRYNNGPGNNNGRYNNGPSNNNGRYNQGNNWDARRAERACISDVENQIRRNNSQSVRIDNVQMDNRRGANDSIYGQASAQDRNRTVYYDFDCRVDLSNGNLRNARVTRRNR